MAAVVVSLGVLAALFPPRAWWEYLVGAAVATFLVLMSVLEANRAWIVVDESSVQVSDFSKGSRAMSRDDVVDIEALGLGWHIRGRDGTVLALRPIWSKKEVAALARELGVPIQS
jgi:hypothetical protein